MVWVGLMANVALLWHKVEPNQEFHGLVCEGASVLPTKFLQDAFRGGYGRLYFVLHL
jgi:outer membrane protein insertion porin family